MGTHIRASLIENDSLYGVPCQGFEHPVVHDIRGIHPRRGRCPVESLQCGTVHIRKTAQVFFRHPGFYPGTAPGGDDHPYGNPEGSIKVFSIEPCDRAPHGQDIGRRRLPHTRNIPDRGKRHLSLSREAPDFIIPAAFGDLPVGTFHRCPPVSFQPHLHIGLATGEPNFSEKNVPYRECPVSRGDDDGMGKMVGGRHRDRKFPVSSDRTG